MKKTKQRVTIFQREYNGTTKLWMNYRVNGKRFREPLNLYLDPGTTSEAKIKNSNTMRLAQKIAEQKSEELIAAELGIQVRSQKLTTFADYAALDIQKSTDKAPSYIEQKKKAAKLVLEYSPNIRMVDFNRQTFKGFVDFLINKGMCNNTVITFATMVKGFIHRAHLDGITSTKMDFTGLLPKRIKPNRQFLTIDELRKLVNTPCKERFRNPFLFSCFTGLRCSDIRRLKWSDIQNGVIMLRQFKTKEMVQIPLSENAKNFLPQKQGTFVFNMSCRDIQTAHMNQWFKDAGITKHITFHCARHTFATLLLANGCDIYTTSKLLGHSSVATTAIYTKVLDEGRKKAVDSIPTI